jgi:hypothetical protein
MPRQRKILLGCLTLLLLVVISAILVEIRQTSEPVFQGQKLNRWVGELASRRAIAWGSSVEARAAIEAVGTNGLPFYIKWFTCEPDQAQPVKIGIAKVARKWLRLSWSPEGEMEARRLGASFALGLLGERAAPAIPYLLNYATNQANGDTMGRTTRTLFVLAQLGRPALPALLVFMKNRDPYMRSLAAAQASALGSNEVTVAELGKLLNDIDPSVRETATNCLKSFQQPKSVRSR